MYVKGNPKTKKRLREMVADPNINVELFQPNNIFGVDEKRDGVFTVEGPHFPQPHRWYANVEQKDGFVIRVIN